MKTTALSAFSFLIQVDIQTVQRHPETPVNVAGFHFPSKVNLVQAAFGLNSQMCSDADFCVSQKSVEPVTRSGPTQKDIHADEFSSFLFWRDPLPKLDSELMSLLVSPLAAGCEHSILQFPILFECIVCLPSSRPGFSGGSELYKTRETSRIIHRSGSIFRRRPVQQFPVLEGAAAIHRWRPAGDTGQFGTIHRVEQIWTVRTRRHTTPVQIGYVAFFSLVAKSWWRPNIRGPVRHKRPAWPVRRWGQREPAWVGRRWGRWRRWLDHSQ